MPLLKDFTDRDVHLSRWFSVVEDISRSGFVVSCFRSKLHCLYWLLWSEGGSPVCKIATVFTGYFFGLRSLSPCVKLTLSLLGFGVLLI
jgi:hypothetical protein